MALSVNIKVHVAYSLLGIGLFNKDYARRLYFTLSLQGPAIFDISVWGAL